MRIFFTGKNARQGLKDTDPTSLVSVASALGITVSENLSPSDDLLVCADFDVAAQRQAKRAKRIGVPTCLIVNEPAVVIPQHAQDRVLKQFDRTIYIGRPTQDPKLKWPQTWTHLRDSSERMDRAVVVNADKWSYIRGQHYWLRSAISSSDSRVDVFGPGWSRPGRVRLAHRVYELARTLASRTLPTFKGLSVILQRPRNYLGLAADKIATMSKYKVAIVIENSSELITEKLFDAWFAGCIPVYVGPGIPYFDLPGGLIVDGGSGSLAALQEGLEEAFSRDHHEHMVALRVFLESSEAKKWKSEQAIPAILKSVLSTLDSRN